MPRFPAWGPIEKTYTNPGQPYQEASGKAGPYTRNEKDWTARQLGTYTLDEVKEKTKFYTAKKDLQARSAQFGRVMNVAVDRMHKQDTKDLPRLWEKLTKEGYTGPEIVEGLKREIMTRVMEQDVKGMGQGQSSKQRELIRLYQELN